MKTLIRRGENIINSCLLQEDFHDQHIGKVSAPYSPDITSIRVKKDNKIKEENSEFSLIQNLLFIKCCMYVQSES
jgi:ribosomal protein L19